jgi:hypothetical protein
MKMGSDMRSRTFGIAFSAKNGKKVAANSFKTILNIIIWPVLHTGTGTLVVRNSQRYVYW